MSDAETIDKCVEKVTRRIHKTLAKLKPEFHKPLLSSLQLALAAIENNNLK